MCECRQPRYSIQDTFQHSATTEHSPLRPKKTPPVPGAPHQSIWTSFSLTEIYRQKRKRKKKHPPPKNNNSVCIGPPAPTTQTGGDGAQRRRRRRRLSVGLKTEIASAPLIYFISCGTHLHSWGLMARIFYECESRWLGFYALFCCFMLRRETGRRRIRQRARGSNINHLSSPFRRPRVT